MAIKPPSQLPGNVQLIDPKTGLPTAFFLRYFNDAVVATIAALASTENAQAAADAANAAADNANAAAETVAADNSLANSYVTGLTLTATDAGSNATVSISAHTRVYGDGTSVSVDGGSVTGLPYSTVARIYYDDPDREGGAVTYQSTPDATVAAQTGNRHSVGAVTTPAGGGGPVAGNPVLPPGTAQP